MSAKSEYATLSLEIHELTKHPTKIKSLSRKPNFLIASCSDIWKSMRALSGNRKMDIHTKLMKKYKSVPTIWFLIILVLNIALIIFVCEHYIESLQLPWWGVLLACAIAIFFTLPIGIINATTNQVSVYYPRDSGFTFHILS